jgi:hypothetical protein
MTIQDPDPKVTVRSSLSDYSDEEASPDTWRVMPEPSPSFITNKEALMDRVRRFVIFQKGSDSKDSYRAVFDRYAKNGRLDEESLGQVLSDAYACAPSMLGGVTRTVKDVLAAMDKNKDGQLDWDEFSSGVHLP